MWTWTVDHLHNNKLKKSFSNLALVQVWTEHEDSVYTAEWSVADPWTFASLSYDGRLVLGHVPQQVKFSILNLG